MLSLQRFNAYCIDNNIKYLRNVTNGNAVDGNINQFRFQAKFTSLNRPPCTTYEVKSFKSGGRFNGQPIKASYEKGDFDYIIVEVGGTEDDPHKYEGNFCIIPAKELINQNILRSDQCKGKNKFMVCPPDWQKDHWTKKYWNTIPPELCYNILIEEI